MSLQLLPDATRGFLLQIEGLGGGNRGCKLLPETQEPRALSESRVERRAQRAQSAEGAERRGRSERRACPPTHQRDPAHQNHRESSPDDTPRTRSGSRSHHTPNSHKHTSRSLCRTPACHRSTATLGRRRMYQTRAHINHHPSHRRSVRVACTKLEQHNRHDDRGNEPYGRDVQVVPATCHDWVHMSCQGRCGGVGREGCV